MLHMSCCESLWHESESTAALLACVINVRAVAFLLSVSSLLLWRKKTNIVHKNTYSVDIHIISHHTDWQCVLQHTWYQSLTKRDFSQMPWMPTLCAFHDSSKKRLQERKRDTLLENYQAQIRCLNCIPKIETERKANMWELCSSVPSAVSLYSQQLLTHLFHSLLLCNPYSTTKAYSMNCYKTCNKTAFSWPPSLCIQTTMAPNWL